ncbi:hypothetical protein KZJ38_16065 [Paraburkholderia edwinii]|uniref:Uncharacterized protein n=1 Tax=Paraburkholderia edwinii TaxID=2861782 RepID=A0ABX8UG19_9BURK|nr:hypothetical protein [Paraburkholderia edwinii]QYD67828.1 hypothetical protein KZJ38_16065 [Paraburkholderia edwinii]
MLGSDSEWMKRIFVASCFSGEVRMTLHPSFVSRISVSRSSPRLTRPAQCFVSIKNSERRNRPMIPMIHFSSRERFTRCVIKDDAVKNAVVVTAKSREAPT